MVKDKKYIQKQCNRYRNLINTQIGTCFYCNNTVLPENMKNCVCIKNALKLS